MNAPRSWAARLRSLSLLNPRSPYPCRWSCVPPHIACDCLICKQMTRRSNIRVRGLWQARKGLSEGGSVGLAERAMWVRMFLTLIESEMGGTRTWALAIWAT